MKRLSDGELLVERELQALGVDLSERGNIEILRRIMWILAWARRNHREGR